MSKAPLFIDDTPSRTMTEIAATARRLEAARESATGRDRLLAVDRAGQRQRPAAGAGGQDRPALKGLARELKVPVLCLAQLNRQAEVYARTTARG